MADKQHQEEGSDEKLELEQFAELAGKVAINCLEGTGYNTHPVAEATNEQIGERIRKPIVEQEKNPCSHYPFETLSRPTLMRFNRAFRHCPAEKVGAL